MTKNRLISLLIVIIALLPPFVYWLAVRQSPSITPEAAKEILKTSGDSGTNPILLDVRSESDYLRSHIKGSVHLTKEMIESQPDGEWRQSLIGKDPIFVICNVGVESARVSGFLINAGFENVRNVSQGLDGWFRDHYENCDADLCMLETRYGLTPGVKPKKFPMAQQTAIVAAAFGLKPIYELISLALVVLLWKNKNPDVIAVRRSMAAFFLGESACAVNFLFFGDQSPLLEYLHSMGMAFCFGFFSYALMDALDQRVIRFSDLHQKCAFLPICGSCYKYGEENEKCRLHTIFPILIIGTGVLMCMPFTAEIAQFFYTGNIFGDKVFFGHLLLYQYVEVKLCPLIAIFFFMLSLLSFHFSENNDISLPKILFAIGLGPMAFGLLRFIIYWCYQDNPLWADFWEECSEFVFIFFIAGFFWVFRGFFRQRS